MTQTATTLLPVEFGDRALAVTTRDLTKRYGSVAAVGGLDLQLPERGVYVLVGPNGAGKSTLIRVLMGLGGYDHGVVDVLGLDPRTQGSGIRAATGYVPEGQELGYARMSVGRLLRHHEVYRPTWDKGYARRLTMALEIDLDKRCGALSKGQRRRVQLVLALAHRPPLLLMDEPTDGLDHVIRDVTLGLLSEHLSDCPTTVLISTHRVYEVERLVDHVGVLCGGRLLGQMPRAELRSKLLRYWADVPEGWSGAPELNGRVIRRGGTGREIEWTAWGERDQVTGALTRAGATVHDVTPLSVDEAAIALLSRKEAS
ncbi:MAG TPA: ABC transporter ATP-binding protein [Longimicrobiales bacterium]|nr:ABC transporter ATP-binding protein [Longimicrobiales bacterium]